MLLLQSPNHPWSNAYAETDSSVFIYVARVILNGGTPYVDVFDHKGPILYLINVIGFLIHSHWGIWLVEIIFLTTTFLAAYKTAHLFSESCFFSIAAVITSFSTLGVSLQSGNYTEEFTMLFQMIALYLFCCYFLSGKLIGIHITCIGVCFALAALTRLNLVVGWIPCCVYIFFELICKKDMKGIAKCVGYFCLGAAIICLPVFIYLKANGAFEKFLSDYLIYNFAYAGRNDMEALIVSAKEFGNNRIVQFTFLMNLIALFFGYRNRHSYPGVWKAVFVNFVCYCVSFLIIVLPGNVFWHYLMCLLPYMVIPTAYGYDILWSKFSFKYGKILLFICACILLWKGIYPQWHLSGEVTFHILSEKEKTLTDYLNEVMDENDEVLVMGSINCCIYNDTNRFAPTRYAYWPFSATENMLKEYTVNLQTNPPDYVVVYESENCLFDLIRDDYKKINQFDRAQVYARLKEH